MKDIIREFLARTVPWPEDGEGYCVIQTTFEGRDFAKTKTLGRSHKAYKTLEETYRAIVRGLADNNSTKDIFICTSRQSQAEEAVSASGHRYLKGHRGLANTLYSKALFMDVDIKEGYYSSIREAIAEMRRFQTEAKLPLFSQIVNSGAGLHFYWLLDTPLKPVEWLPLAHGLINAARQHGIKLDNVTTDISRVLRVPNTKNYKYDPPLDTSLLHALDYTYSVDTLKEALTPYIGNTPIANVASDGWENIPPRIPAADLVDELGVGVDTAEDIKFNIRDLGKVCDFIKKAVTSGGKDYSQPLWNLTTLMATFMDNGRNMAHVMGCKHPGYSFDSTEEMYDRKEREREQLKLGWPKCATVDAAGFEGCKSCPHFQANKTPMHHALQLKAQAFGPAFVPPISTAPTKDPDLPKSFGRRPSGVIAKHAIMEDGSTIDIDICAWPMNDAYLHMNRHSLNFKTKFNGRAKTVELPLREIATRDGFKKAIWSYGLTIHENEVKLVHDFMASWIEKLQTIKGRVVTSVPYGWSISEKDDVEGFVYDEILFTPQGQRPASPPDPVIADNYRSRGKIENWKKATQLVTDRNNPGFNAIIAASIGAPFVQLTGLNGMVMSVKSADSGIGKTTAIRIAQSVWCHPIKGTPQVTATTNFLTKILATIKHLPIFWDEMRDASERKQFANLVFRVTQGGDRGRLNRQGNVQPQEDWNTLMITGSNESILDHVNAAVTTTEAGIYRTFEYTVFRDPKTHSTTEANQRMRLLNFNYGCAGRVIAEYLGSNFQSLLKELVALSEEIEEELKVDQAERQWLGLVVVTIMGARIANRLNLVDLPEEPIRQHMIKSFERMRAEINNSSVDLTKPTNLGPLVAAFLAENRARHLLLTDIVYHSSGRPPKNAVSIRNDLTKVDKINVQIGDADGYVRISRLAFEDFLKSRNIFQINSIFENLTQVFNAKFCHGVIGAGTMVAASQAKEQVIDFDTNGLGVAFFDK